MASPGAGAEVGPTSQRPPCPTGDAVTEYLGRKEPQQDSPDLAMRTPEPGRRWARSHGYNVLPKTDWQPVWSLGVLAPGPVPKLNSGSA